MVSLQDATTAGSSMPTVARLSDMHAVSCWIDDSDFLSCAALEMQAGGGLVRGPTTVVSAGSPTTPIVTAMAELPACDSHTSDESGEETGTCNGGTCQKPVYNYGGNFIVTETQNHGALTTAGGAEQPTGQTYQCGGRLTGGWGVNQADDVSCSMDTHPLDATYESAFGTISCYSAYYDCEALKTP